jgi:hypothetical protein
VYSSVIVMGVSEAAAALSEANTTSPVEEFKVIAIYDVVVSIAMYQFDVMSIFDTNEIGEMYGGEMQRARRRQ